MTTRVHVVLHAYFMCSEGFSLVRVPCLVSIVFLTVLIGSNTTFKGPCLLKHKSFKVIIVYVDPTSLKFQAMILNPKISYWGSHRRETSPLQKSFVA